MERDNDLGSGESTVNLWLHSPVVNVSNIVTTLIDSIPALVAYIDCNMVLQYCNQPFKKGFSITDKPGQSFPLIAGKEIFEQVQFHMGKVLSGERARFQISIHSEEGLQYLDATLSPDFDQYQKVRGFVFHSADITEKNRTERSLKEYFENATIGLHWVDSNGIILWANPAELKMLGYTQEEYIGHHISEFHADKKAISDILHRLTNKETLTNCEADLSCKDGSLKHVSINSTVLWEGEKFIHTRCFTVDVTQQRLAARAVSESEEKFKMMASLVPLIIWATDENGDCNFLNERWMELTGQPVEDGLGKQWTNLIHPEDKENIILAWTRSLLAKKSFDAKFRFLNAEGDYTVTYANASPKFNSSGEFSGYIGILQDISSEERVKSSLEKIVVDRTNDLIKRNGDLRRAEKALQEKNEELEKINNQLSSFAHVASHDLQEPLRKIQMLSGRLFELEGDKYSEKGKEFHQRILDASARMRTLIQDLLTYSKSSNNEGKSEKVDLNVLINEVISELEVKISDKKAVIKNLGLPELNGVRFQFHQLLLNFLSNALKFSRPNIEPLIVLSSEVVKGMDVPGKDTDADCLYHHITITDNGIGFEADEAEKMFDMFYRVHSHSQYEGTGIGLAICKKIVVDNHKGIIIPEGRINNGATFHIYLPNKNEFHVALATN